MTMCVCVHVNLHVCDFPASSQRRQLVVSEQVIRSFNRAWSLLSFAAEESRLYVHWGSAHPTPPASPSPLCIKSTREQRLTIRVSQRGRGCGFAVAWNACVNTDIRWWRLTSVRLLKVCCWCCIRGPFYLMRANQQSDLSVWSMCLCRWWWRKGGVRFSLGHVELTARLVSQVMTLASVKLSFDVVWSL